MARAKRFEGRVISFDAAADLSAKHHFFMQVDMSGEVDIPAGQGEHTCGVLENKPTAQGQAASIMVDGAPSVVCGNTIAAGGLVTPGADGRAEAALMGDIVWGTALSGGAVGETISVLRGSGHIVP